MQEQENPSYIKGAAILAAVSVFVKIIGAIYKIPLFQDGVLGDEGTADFQVTYNVYTLILTVSTAGVPAALSRMVSSAKAKGDRYLVNRYFGAAMPAFFLIGLVLMFIMFFFADGFAVAMGNSKAAPGIRVLSPAVFSVCIISVYRGYAQGFQNMIPTAISQIVEVLCKAAIGIAVALWFVSLGYESHIVSAGAIVGVTIGLGLCIPLLYRQKKKIAATLPAFDALTIPPENTGFLQGLSVFGQIMKVSVPITISASFVSLMVVLDSSIVMRRLQDALGMTETAARGLYGIYSRALSIYNLVPSILVPVSISILPAIAAALASNRKSEAKEIMQSSVKLVNLIAMPAAAGLMVLAMPILTALYNDQREIAQMIMSILGAASFFVCLQYVTMTILQAHGHERISLITFSAGATVRIVLAWFLTGNPNINILASPIGTLVCFAIISVMNIMFINVKLKDAKPEFLRIFTGPLICSAVMSVIARGIYELLSHYLSDYLGSARFEAIIFLAVSVIAGVSVYIILIVATRTITMEDLKLIPKGGQIGRLIRVKQSKK